MNKKEKDAKWNELAQKHEALFGKKPRANMKLETLEKKVNDSEPDTTPEEVEVNPKIGELLEELSKEAQSEATDDRPAMISLVSGSKGIHMSMLGEGQDVAILLATAMSSQPMIEAVVANAYMMAQMRKQQVAQKAGEVDLPTLKTEA